MDEYPQVIYNLSESTGAFFIVFPNIKKGFRKGLKPLITWPGRDDFNLSLLLSQ